jgi:hypothetical protein
MNFHQLSLLWIHVRNDTPHATPGSGQLLHVLVAVSYALTPTRQFPSPSDSFGGDLQRRSNMSATTTHATHVDPRGLRVAAAITSVVVALVLVLPSPAREILLAVQVGVFALAAFVGLKHSPYSIFFAKVIRPRIGAPAELEDSRPPRFAQLVGFVFTTVALLAFVAGAATVGLIATAFALVAALLNAAIGLCLGCELYLVLRRFTPANA